MDLATPYAFGKTVDMYCSDAHNRKYGINFPKKGLVFSQK